MSRKEVIRVPGLPDPHRNALEHCVRVGDLVFVAGQVAFDEQGEVISTDFDAQARACFEDVRLCLEAAGSSLADLVSMTVFLTDIERSRDFFKIRREVLGADLSTSAVVGVSALVHPRLLVEIQAVGAVSNPQQSQKES